MMEDHNAAKMQTHEAQEAETQKSRRVSSTKGNTLIYGFVAMIVILGAGVFVLNQLLQSPPSEEDASQAANVDLLGMDEVITAEDPSAYIGDSILLTNAEVQSVTTDFGTFWVGPDAGSQIYVMLSEPLSDRIEDDVLNALQEGEHVTLRGTIEAMPDGEDAQNRLDDADRDPALNELPVYLLADEITLETQLDSDTVAN